ncbi:MAG: PEP-CTERM sorting domain-containing protein [Tepidisphaeraceae bacterium]
MSLTLAAATSNAATINFDSRKHGQVITDDYLLSKGVVFSAVNFQGGPDLAVAFDSGRSQTDDHDLEDPWNVGNIPSSTRLWKILIVAENDIDLNRDGLLDHPDDQGSTPALGLAGQLELDFAAPHRTFGLDLVDVEPGDEIGFIAFHLRGVEIARVGFDEFITPASPFYDPTIVFGDNSANRIQPITAEQLNIVAFDKVVVGTGMCLAIDNLNFQLYDGALPSVPEPSALAAIGLAFTTWARRRRRDER